jgi:hypothetical protein
MLNELAFKEVAGITSGTALYGQKLERVIGIDA